MLNEEKSKKIIEAITTEVDIPDQYIWKIISDINKYSVLANHWESPYTRPTFAKIFLIIILLLFIWLWLIFPVYQLFTNSISIDKKIQDEVLKRNKPLGEDFAYNLVINENLNWIKTVSLYDKDNKELLAKSDLVNNSSFLVANKKGKFELKPWEKEILKVANSDLKEEIKDTIYDLLKSNISVNDKYLKFKPIDFWVNQIINIKN